MLSKRNTTLTLINQKKPTCASAMSSLVLCLSPVLSQYMRVHQQVSQSADTSHNGYQTVVSMPHVPRLAPASPPLHDLAAREPALVSAGPPTFDTLTALMTSHQCSTMRPCPSVVVGAFVLLSSPSTYPMAVVVSLRCQTLATKSTGPTCHHSSPVPRKPMSV